MRLLREYVITTKLIFKLEKLNKANERTTKGGYK